MLSRCPWWWAPVLAFAWIVTVPAQSFWAPTRAKLMAAARDMPGVWAVLVSRLSAGTTQTPLCFHGGSLLEGTTGDGAVSAIIAVPCEEWKTAGDNKDEKKGVVSTQAHHLGGLSDTCWRTLGILSAVAIDGPLRPGLTSFEG